MPTTTWGQGRINVPRFIACCGPPRAEEMRVMLCKAAILIALLWCAYVWLELSQSKPICRRSSVIGRNNRPQSSRYEIILRLLK